jgi:UDP-N-acetyl-2-amino-2-deoxyglucuronate dehydrogenase
MTGDVVRFGIIGLGMGSVRAETATQTPGAKLACVCSLDEGQAREWGAKLGCDWTVHYEELLDRKDIDVVGVLTPSGTHADLVVQCLQAGKHTFTTKPMDIDVKKCDAAIAAAKQTGRILAVDFGLRYSPLSHQIRMAVQSGKLGRILFADLIMKWHRTQAYYDGGLPAGWRSRWVTERGSIANQGVHSLDLLQWFLGPVSSVYGEIGTLNHKIETEDSAMAMLRFASGARGLLHTTTCSVPELGTQLEIGGDAGSLAWNENKIVQWHCESDPKATLNHFQVDPNLPHSIIEDMVSAVTKGTPVQCDGQEGRKAVSIFSAIYESARMGKVIKLG